MERYDKYEDWVKWAHEELPEIPKVITEEWLREQLLNRQSPFRNWGFCFEDYKNLVRGIGKHYDTPLTMEHEIDVLKEVGFNKIDKYITDDYRIIVASKHI